ncbi:MAG: BadF/BadG/BcrA/BcrD ATPase family protein, partial [Alphaproteobacteria bacterium]
MINEKKYSIGLDAGSTTLKIVATDSLGDVVFFDYSRHHANVSKALTEALRKLKAALGDVQVHIQVTGSAGMGVSERFGVPFIQEVVAASHVVKVKYPETKTLIDIGGEDSKMIFFGKNMQADIRMNGNCAGGTGAFIDQMATLMDITPTELDELSLKAERIYPIASRCGVFAKTDIQPLLNQGARKEDVAASI